MIQKDLSHVLQHYRSHPVSYALHQLKQQKAMQNVFTPIAVLGTIGASIYYFTKVLTDYVLKKKMIEKGYVNEDSQSIFKEYQSDNRYSALKWGLIVLSGGIGLIIINSLDVRPDSTLPYGILAVSLSMGFLAYYFSVKRWIR